MPASPNISGITALGTTSTPPNQVLVGLALFLTLFVMSPVLDRAYADGYKPFSDGTITMDQAMTRGVAPFKQFMLRQTREADLALFARIAKAPPMNGPEDVPLLLEHFGRCESREIGGDKLHFVPRAIDKLTAYSWPGNVAELRDVVRRLCLRKRRGQVELSDVEAVLPPVEERVPVEQLFLGAPFGITDFHANLFLR